MSKQLLLALALILCLAICAFVGNTKAQSSQPVAIYLNAGNRSYNGTVPHGSIIMAVNNSDPAEGPINFYVNDFNFATVGQDVQATFILFGSDWQEIAERGL